MMDMFFKMSGIILLMLIFLVLLRVIKGPTVLDRLVSVNVIGTKATVLLVIMGVIFKRVDMFVDIAIGYGLLNFIASIAAAKYFQRHQHIRPETQWKKDLREN